MKTDRDRRCPVSFHSRPVLCAVFINEFLPTRPPSPSLRFTVDSMIQNRLIGSDVLVLEILHTIQLKKLLDHSKLKPITPVN